jgi:imidazolonepropionase-like amidohydrolase
VAPQRWHVHASRLPAGGEASDLWVDAAGRLSSGPVAGAEDLPGRFVLPGLVDAHAHLTLDMSGTGLRRGSRQLVDANLVAHLRVGVLLVRDAGAVPGARVGGDRAGRPAVVAAGRWLAPAGGYLPDVIEPVPAEGLVAAALAELAASDGWVKVVADFPTSDRLAGEAPPHYDPDLLRAVVGAVHAAGGRVAAHTTGPAVADAVAAGVDSVEHGVSLDEGLLAEMAARGTAWVPTLTTVAMLLGLESRAGTEAERARAAEADARLRELLPAAARLGVTVLAGTDICPHGSVPQEVGYLVRYGLEPAAALAAATTSARAFLGRPALEAGAPADLVTYDADPREHPEVLRRPAAVVLGGRRVV